MKYQRVIYCLVIMLLSGSCNLFTSKVTNVDRELIEVFEIAKKENKLILAEFTLDNCKVCDDINNLIENDIVDYVNENYIYCKIQCDMNTKEFIKLFRIQGFPSYIVFDQNKDIKYRWEGMKKGTDLSNQFRRVVKLSQLKNSIPNIDSNNSYSFLYQAYLKIDNNKYVEAMVLLEKSIEWQPCFYNTFLKFKLLVNQGKKSEAIQIAEKALAFNEPIDMVWYSVHMNELERFIAGKDLTNLPAEIGFGNKVFDFGKIKLSKHQKLLASFNIKNEGDKPLLVKYVSTSCKCSEPVWNKAPLKSGLSDKIKVMFNPDKLGKFTKTLMVFSNDLDSPHKIRIMGEVISDKS